MIALFGMHLTPKSGRKPLELCKLCWHNFEHNRQASAFENNASIIGLKQELPKYVAVVEGVSTNTD